MPKIRFDEQVIIVTGAGGGLGLAHARLLASRGARVVVNDTGGNVSGGNADASAAESVVADIRSAGGEAVAVAESVENGDRIVEAAMDHYSRLDAVVNNAGILRDKSFKNLTDDDWDAVYRVHLLGSYRVTRAAWPMMIAREYGRIVMTTSASGLFGNFGQANYGAAKFGVVGLVTTLALEGARYGIRINALSPSAASRMTEEMLPSGLKENLKPDCISPLVACLVHDSCPVSGQIFEAAGGWFDRVRLQRSKGLAYGAGEVVEPETLVEDWDDFNDFEAGNSPETPEEAVAPIIENLGKH